MTPSCWRPPWRPLWCSGRSPLTRHPSTYVWTKGMTIPPATKLPLPTGIRPTYDALVRRSWIAPARRPSRPDVGWWNEPCRGCPSAEDYLSVTTKRHPISWVYCNWPAVVGYCGTGEFGAYCFGGRFRKRLIVTKLDFVHWLLEPGMTPCRVMKVTGRPLQKWQP